MPISIAKHDNLITVSVISFSYLAMTAMLIIKNAAIRAVRPITIPVSSVVRPIIFFSFIASGEQHPSVPATALITFRAK
jgi:hypothetical protein